MRVTLRKYALMIGMALLLTLAGCGKKGVLQPPPNSQAAPIIH